jgi:D-alanyl-D-alanine carboxypeptidase
MEGPGYRRHEPQVYRLRRAGAATVLVLLVFGVYQLAGGGGGGHSRATTTTSSTSTTLPTAPRCTVGDTPTPQNPKTEWASTVVDTNLALPATYGPPDLHNISDAGFPFTQGLALRGFLMADLSSLRKAAAANGTPIQVLTAYRSYQTQKDLYAHRVQERGGSEAGSHVARPGHSEHQLGTVLDVASPGMTDVDQAWGTTATGEWVKTNAYKYGFVLSYPTPDSSATTCFDYEPWHLRYVGTGTAAAVIRSGLTLRAYQWQQLARAGRTPATVVTSSTSTTVATSGGSP